MLKKHIILALSAAIFLSCSDNITGPASDESGGGANPGERGHVPDSNPPEIERYLFVVNNLGETISRIDVASGSVVNNIYTTGQVPAEIQYRDDILYIINSGDNTLLMINIVTGARRWIEIGDYRNPSHMELIGTDMAAVCNWEAGTVSFLDLAAGTVIEEIQVGAGLWGMTAYEGNIFVGVSNYNPTTWTYGQGRVAALDAAARILVDSIDVGVNPGVLFIDHQGELNVVCIGDYFSIFGEVWRVNPTTYTVIDNYHLGGSPNYEALAPDGMVYLGAGGWVNEGYVLKYDSNAESVINGGSNPIVLSGESGAQGAALDSEGNVYVCCFNTDHVVKMDASGNVLDTYAVGDGPQALVYVQREETLVWQP